MDRPTTIDAESGPDAYVWAFLALAVVLAVVHLYLGLFAAFVPDERATQFLVVAFALLFGPVVFFTPFWRPLGYLLGAAFVTYLGVLWVLGGLEFLPLGVLVGVLAVTFVLLGLYLFVREEDSAADSA